MFPSNEPESFPVYEDLTPYRHRIDPFQFPDVQNVGWIDVCASYVTGSIPARLIDKLVLLAGNKRSFRPLVEPIRALPTCNLCGEIRIQSLDGTLIPEGELWIPSEDNGLFSSPTRVVHSIMMHQYLPPQPYLEAVERIDPNASFDAEAEYRRRLISSSWNAL